MVNSAGIYVKKASPYILYKVQVKISKSSTS